MKVAMIGSGAAGSVFAAYLRRGGAELHLVDPYKAHMDKIAAEGLTFTEPSGTSLLTGFHTYGCADELNTMDLVIIMVKATQTDMIMPAVLSCTDNHTVVVTLQNGLGNEDRIANYVPRDRILYGFGTIGTELPSPGHCVSKPEPGVIMRFGAAKKSPLTIQAGLFLEQCFKAGGCEARFEKDIRPYVWKKAISNSGYNTLSALLRLKVGQYIGQEAGEALLLSVWEEGCRVAQCVLGIDLWPELQAELENVRIGFTDYYPSMAQDMLIHHRQTEVALLNGAIADYGKRYGVPTPLNCALTQMVTCIQSNYENQFLVSP